MKKQVFSGLALMLFAFTGAAFTANEALQTNHYIQKPGECKQIPVTNCTTSAPNPCEAEDMDVDYPVFQSRQSASQCQTPLLRPNTP